MACILALSVLTLAGTKHYEVNELSSSDLSAYLEIFFFF